MSRSSGRPEPEIALMNVGVVLLALAAAQGALPDELALRTPISRVTRVSLQETPAPEYPVTTVPLPCVRVACGSVTLIDLSVGVLRDGGTDQEVEARVKISDRAFVGGRAGTRHQSLRLTTHRVGFAFRHGEGTFGVDGSYRAPRMLLEARTERRGDEQGQGWSSELRAAVRFGQDFELLVGGLTAAVPKPTAFLADSQLQRVSGGFIWQRGVALEIVTEASSARLESGGRQFDRDRVGTEVVYYWPPGVRFMGQLAYARDRGFIPSTIRTAGLGVEAQVGSHLVARGGYVGRSELDLGSVDENYRMGLTLFARRHTFDRTGESAERTLALARRATAMGYNERRVHTLDGRRALRERLSLSANRDELADEIEALYQSQVQDRNVPHLGFEWSREKDPVRGSVRTTLDVFAGLPWRLGWSLRTRDDVVNFLVFGYSYVENDFIRSTSYERQYRAEVALNRETNIVVVWIDPDQTRLENALNIPVFQRWEARLVHRSGR